MQCIDLQERGSFMFLKFLRNITKKFLKPLNDWEITSNICDKSYFENKAYYFNTLKDLSVDQQVKEKKIFYIHQDFYVKYHLRKFLRKLAEPEIENPYFNAARWIFIDLLVGRERRTFGIYQFIALPGEGKTMSMVAHMERYRKERIDKGKVQGKDFVIATNFHYVNQDYSIDHWTDIVRIAKSSYDVGIQCLIAMDEIHITFDSSDYKDFPAEMLSVLSFCRKYSMQFLCSAQIYERIPKKIRDIANFTVVCKNVGHLDRLFRDYYYEKNSYEKDIAGALEGGKGHKKKKMYSYFKDFCADNNFYALYDTKEQVERMVKDAKSEKNKKMEAFNILFNPGSPEE